MRIKDLIKLLRIQQWYKNLLIFLALFLVGKIINLDLFLIVLVGFFSLAFMSSAGYILNDLIDVKKDRLHPEKKYRPIASGKVSYVSAIIIMFLLIFSSIALAYILNPYFVFFPLILLLSCLFYTIYFKRIPIINLYFIAFNHVLRAFAGAFLISVMISPWFILFIFILSMFLAAAKKKSDSIILGNKMDNYHKFLDLLVLILLTVMLITYILYSFMAHETYYFMLTIPFASFIILRYLYFITVNHKILRKTEYFFFDKQMLIGFLLWILTAFIVIYIL